MVHDNTHKSIYICYEKVCGDCYEEELMQGRVKFAPRHATKPIEFWYNPKVEKEKARLKKIYG